MTGHSFGIYLPALYQYGSGPARSPALRDEGRDFEIWY
jgi:hypothetical protein